MKSTITKEKYLEIYEMLNKVSPVDYDCGRLCEAACCTCNFEPDDIEFTAEGDENADNYMGLYLLPGEEKVYEDEFGSNEAHDNWIKWGSIRAEDYEYPESWTGRVYFIECKTAPKCNREYRPIQCRTFPLAPHISEDDTFHVIVNCDLLPYECPLLESAFNDDGEYELNQDFVDVTWQAWNELVKDPLIYDLVKMDSDYRIEDDAEIIIMK